MPPIFFFYGGKYASLCASRLTMRHCAKGWIRSQIVGGFCPCQTVESVPTGPNKAPSLTTPIIIFYTAHRDIQHWRSSLFHTSHPIKTEEYHFASNWPLRTPPIFLRVACQSRWPRLSASSTHTTAPRTDSRHAMPRTTWRRRSAARRNTSTSEAWAGPFRPLS